MYETPTIETNFKEMGIKSFFSQFPILIKVIYWYKSLKFLFFHQRSVFKHKSKLLPKPALISFSLFVLSSRSCCQRVKSDELRDRGGGCSICCVSKQLLSTSVHARTCGAGAPDGSASTGEVSVHAHTHERARWMLGHSNVIKGARLLQTSFLAFILL